MQLSTFASDKEDIIYNNKAGFRIARNNLIAPQSILLDSINLIEFELVTCKASKLLQIIAPRIVFNKMLVKGVEKIMLAPESTDASKTTPHIIYALAIFPKKDSFVYLDGGVHPVRTGQFC
jgi:hypothetical protein